MVIYRSYSLKLNKQMQMVKLPSLTCLKLRIWLLNGKITIWTCLKVETLVKLNGEMVISISLITE